jgi:hypothetical protein
MSEFYTLTMTLWFVSLVIAGAAGMTALLRMSLAALFLVRVAANWMAALNWTRERRLVSDRLPIGVAMSLDLKPCD